MTSYLFVADETGTPGMAPGITNAFVFGGYVVSEGDLPGATGVWRQIKTETCGRADIELKWKHFFVETNHPHIHVPLLIEDLEVRRRLAASVLDQLFQSTPIIPVVAVSRKDRVTDLFTVQSRKGKDKIDDDLMWLGPVAQFSLFLDAHKARGKLWFDRLGSEKHEARRQATWSEQLRMVREDSMPSESKSHLEKLLAIEEKIRFLDSEVNDAVQIADFVCGVIWQAAEGDEAYLAQLAHKYGPNATRQGLGILHVG